MSSNLKTFLFAFVMCLVCALVLTTAVTLLKDRQQENVKLDKQRNILKALGFLEPDHTYARQDIVNIYQNYVRDMWMLPSGELVAEQTTGALPLYVVFPEGGHLARYAIPISGYGLWSWIYGFLALDGDGKTVAGVTFYQHGETPGLGGEVEKEWFQSQFAGKKIVDEQGNFVSVTVVKGKAKDVMPDRLDYAVDGISGATITAFGVRDFIRADLLKYEPLSSHLRQTVPSASEETL